MEAAKRLHLWWSGSGELFHFDCEARDVWNTHRRLSIRMAEAVIASAAKGSYSAIRYGEGLLRDELSAPGLGPRQEIVSDVKLLRTNHE